MPRIPSKATGKARHDPLHVQLGEDQIHEKYGKVSKPGKRVKSRTKDDDEDEGGEVSSIPYRPSTPLQIDAVGCS